MKSAGACFPLSHSALLLAGLIFAPVHAAVAQDSAFLVCERFTDRAQRIACLEDALEAATAEQAPVTTPGATTGTTPTPAQRAIPAEQPAPAAAPSSAATAASPAPVVEQEDEGPSLMDRLRNFGRDDDSATISSDADGQDQLHDTITALESRRDLWIVTLSSGQVWMQEYPRKLNLREGDQVTIYQAGFGNGYRLTTERLSGFIRVKRVR